MDITRQFPVTLLTLLQEMEKRQKWHSVTLGGSSGSGGGGGAPPGGYSGQIAQRYICYDETEALASGSSGGAGDSSSSLVDNLNRLRYWQQPARWFEPSQAGGVVNVRSGIWWRTDAGPMQYAGGSIALADGKLYMDQDGALQIGANWPATDFNPIATISGTTLTDVRRFIGASGSTAGGSSSSSGSAHVIQDKGVNMAQRRNLNFAGNGVTVTDDSANNATLVTINRGSGSGGNLWQLPMLLSGGELTEYPTIQDAINAAVSGEEVWVPPSTYIEEITLKNGVNLVGIGSRDNIVVTSGGFTISTPGSACSCKVQNITVQSSGSTASANCSVVGQHTSGMLQLIGCKVLCSNPTGSSYGVYGAASGSIRVQDFEIIGEPGGASNLGVVAAGYYSNPVDLVQGSIYGNFQYSLYLDNQAIMHLFGVNYESPVYNLLGNVFYLNGDRISTVNYAGAGVLSGGKSGHWGIAGFGAGTERTVVYNPNGTIEVLTAMYSVREAGSGSTSGGTVVLSRGSGSSADIYNDGPRVLKLFLDTSGIGWYAHIKRSSGSGNFSVSLFTTWIEA